MINGSLNIVLSCVNIGRWKYVGRGLEESHQQRESVMC